MFVIVFAKYLARLMVSHYTAIKSDDRSFLEKPMVEAGKTAKKRTKVSQSEFPNNNLETSLRIARALWDHFAGKGAPPHDVAMAIDFSPTRAVGAIFVAPLLLTDLRKVDTPLKKLV